ncbi:metal ABC transporter substrate-binding protein [Pseudarthrobacter sp. NS4]|uniref:metal ABC transporter substrate-binding protein n=1 Tax=Pseudarthrobacter sp. NS4 TaxID=2973976 RepID=UPI0021614D2D|nr:metal ABC transporter substrate-binding protein [Pseudarthrobacter sp. NS4]
MKSRTRLVLAMPLLSALSLTACASGAGEASPSGTSGAGAGAAPLKVMASFYPLQYVTEQVGGDKVEVESLTPPGTEPHDLELSPAAVASLENAAAVVYLSGFQPAVDEAIKQASPARALDVSEEATLPAGHSEHDHGTETHTEAAAEEEGHAEETEAGHSEEAEAGHAEEGQDLHFWLDPERLAHTAHAVAEELAEADPANAAAYEANAEALSGKLTALDGDFSQGLKTCKSRTIVVSHEAYGYLTAKYDLNQAGISGLAPDTEPSPARLAEIGQVVKDEGVSTIFTETLVNPKVAETLAADLNVKTAVLDPLEGLTDNSSDYEKVMRSNLEALRTALDCA